MRQQIEEDRLRAGSTTFQKSGPTKIKVRWSGGDYTKEMLQRIFSKFGDVLEVVVLPGKKKSGGGSGLVEMETKEAAEFAVNIERGFAENPLKIKLLEGSSAEKSSSSKKESCASSATPVTDSFQEFETLVMRQMRQQEERKRLIAEMMKNEDGDN